MKKLIFILSAVFLITACGDKENSSDNDVSGDNDAISVSDENDEFNADPDVTDDTLVDEDESDTAPDIDNDDADTAPDDIGTMIDIPAGSFVMGCSGGDYCSISNSSSHEVKLSAYRIGKYEVTAGEYTKCIKAGNCNNSNENEPHYMTSDGGAYPCNLRDALKKDHPMNCVSWYGAIAYCEWAGKRLPTEAEWEKAARGTDSITYPWGEESPSCEYAVFFPENSYSYACGTGTTWMVGSKEKGKSPYGLYDMAGNAEEWVNDWFDYKYYETSPSEDPKGPETGELKGLRGGSYISSEEGMTTIGRNSKSHYFEGCGYIGFRCAE